MAELFGFEIKRKDQEKEDAKKISFVAPESDDGLGYVVNAGGHFGQYVDMEGDKAKTDQQQIIKYRNLAMQPECDAAIEDIVNESIVADDDSAPVSLVMEDLDQSDKIKKLIQEEFETVIELLNMNWQGHDIFRRWYIDGRLYFHKIIDEKNPKAGIIELRNVDPIKIRKIREVKEDKDPLTGTKMIKGVKDTPGVAAKILGPIGEANIEVDMIVQNVGSDGLADFTFTVSRNTLKKAIQVIEKHKKTMMYENVSAQKNIVKVSIVGVGMRSHAGIAGRMFKCLAKNKVNIRMISTSEIKISVVIEQKSLEIAVQALHNEFKLDKK